MGRITSNIGLITGLPITDTVDQLIGVASRPRDILTSRTVDLKSQQAALTGLSARLQALKFDLSKLNVADPFQARAVSSQDETLLTVALAAGGKPPIGDVSVRPVQTASSQQLISQRFSSLDDIQSSGVLSFGFGGFVDQGISLDDLNSGAGVSRGQIRITDLNGTSAVIDLSFARTIDEVLDTINANTEINVVASADGDAITLTDNVGGVSTLTVQEVAGGATAADLGLSGISTTSSSVTGADLFTLYTGSQLTKLNDGNGVQIRDSVDDLQFDFIDDTTLTLDLAGSTSLGDVIDKINALDPAKLTASISADGNGIDLVDLTGGAETFSVSSIGTGTAAEDLGLTETAVAGNIGGRRLVSGLRDTLLSSLRGGQGVGVLGDIDITDRQGTGPVTIDLSTAETLDDLVDLINASGSNVTASINEARNGITIADTSGGTGTLVVADSGVTTTATALGITNATSVASVNSGTLGRQTLSESTLLSSLNGGSGIDPSDIRITDTNGVSTAIDLNTLGSEAKTIGDVIDAINLATTSGNVGITARINDTGDGILLIDTALGSGSLGVQDVGGTLAKDLNLTRENTTQVIDSQSTVVIDGTNSFRVDLSDLDGNSTAISLASLNNGAGIDFGDFKITDSSEKVLALDLDGADSGITTVGQLIDRINELATVNGVGVTASLNSSETGIRLTDTAGGSEKLTVENVGNSTTATDLKIEGVATTTTIDGVGLFSDQSASQGVLNTIATRINDLDAGVTASTFFDGVGYRLSISVDDSGSANEIFLDAGATGFSFTETSKARDSLLVLGEGELAGSGILVSSTTNTFEEVINGVDITIVAGSESAVNVSVVATDEDFLSVVEGFIDSYNAIQGQLADLTSFNENDLTTGLLFGTNEALRVETSLSRLATDRYLGVGSFSSLEQIGISVDDKGELVLDKTKLKAAFADDAVGLQTFFGDSSNGVAAKFNEAIEQLSGADNGLLKNRSDALQSTIDSNETRIENFNDSLDRQRERLLLQFFQLEQVISGLQQSQTALNSLSPIAPLVSARR